MDASVKSSRDDLRRAFPAETVASKFPRYYSQTESNVPDWQPAATVEPTPFGDPHAAADRPGFEWLGHGAWREPTLALLGLHEPYYLGGYYDPYSSQQFAYGSLGATPYRLGWYAYQDAVYTPAADTHGVSGEFQNTEWNSWMRYSTLLETGHLFAWTGVWNTHFWSGPSGVALPPDVAQLASDFWLASASSSPWNWQLGVTPQLNADFERQLNHNAYMVDARFALLNRLSPHFTVAVGAAFWDRVRDRFIPYGGVTWTPDDRWEVRAMFPKSRASYYLGNFSATDVWIYGVGEYTVDAYQVDLEDATRLKEQAEFRDYRILVGFNAQRPGASLFGEGGIITNRRVDFSDSTPDFDIANSWIVRAGIAY